MFAIWLAEAKPLWMEGAFFVFLFKFLQILLDYDLFILNLLFFFNFFLRLLDICIVRCFIHIMHDIRL